MLNRNIVTRADLDRAAAATSIGELPKTFDRNPPAGLSSAAGAAGAPGYRGGAPAAPAAQNAAPGGVSVPSEDDYLTKLLKYVPIEVIGFYLFLQSVITSNVTKSGDQSGWLGGLLIVTLVLTATYDMRVLSVVRGAQVAMSVVALAVYVFASGGWFATTTWYHAWYASILVPVFAMAIGLFRIGPLPPVQAPDAGG